jgi:putative membrane protein
VYQFNYLVPAIAYAVLGMAILGIAFVIFDLLTPGKLWTIIREENNTAVAQFAGLFALSLALIVAAAIHG